MDQFPLIYTERLMLRQISTLDIDDLLQHVNNRKITDRILNFPHPYEEYHAVFRLSYVYQGFQGKTHYIFAIIYRSDESERFVGEISLHLRGTNQSAELGYWVAEPFWNLGIATEAIAATVSFGIEKLKLRSIYAECHKDNPASQTVLVKNHFEPNGQDHAVVKYIFQCRKE